MLDNIVFPNLPSSLIHSDDDIYCQAKDKKIQSLWSKFKTATSKDLVIVFWAHIKSLTMKYEIYKDWQNRNIKFAE